MVRKLSAALVAMAIGSSALVPAAADAQRYGDPYGYGAPRYERAYDEAYRDGYNQPQRGYYEQAPRTYYDRAPRDRYRCNDGTTGAIVGAIAGGLLGNSVAGRRDRGLGTILGGAGGLLAGRAIGRSGDNGCRR